MGKQKNILRALRGETVIPPPFWFMRQAGRYLPEYREIRQLTGKFLDFCYTPDLAVEVSLQPLERFQPDAVILFSDILVIPDALGQSVEFYEGEGPVLKALRTAEDITKLDPARVSDYLAPVFETLRRLSREIPDQTTLIGFAGAPWTLAVYMVEGHGRTDGQIIRGWANEALDDFTKLIDLLTVTTAEYLIEQVKNGAEVLQVFDSWSGMLKGSEFRRWSIDPTREIVARIHAVYPEVPIIGFPRKAGDGYIRYVSETSVNGVSLDQSVSLKWAKTQLQPICTVQGNLDNEILLAGGNALDCQVLEILETLGEGPFIFNLGHGVLPETPPEHLGRTAELIRSWTPTG